MNIQSLEQQRRVISSQAQAKIRKITDDTDEKTARSIERQFDALMLEHDEIVEQITEARSREPMAHLPKGENISTRGMDDTIPETAAKSAFARFVRNPNDQRAQATLADFSESRAASGLTGSAGGHVVPEIIAGPILSRARDANPMRGVVRVVTVASGDIVFPLSNADATSGWVGETDTRTPTGEPTLDGKVPNFGINYSYVKMTEELANDSVIDIADWFVREAGMAIGEAEMAAIIAGDGVKKPKGMLNVPPESGEDGTRTADAYKFLPAASATAVAADEMLDLIYDLKARYRANGRWLMNSATTGAVRKLKDGDGNYLWQASMIAGQPNTFAGYPVTIVEAMEDIGANNHPIAFGDFEAGYILAQIVGMVVTTGDQSITEPGFNKVYIRQRIGGCVYDENAVRFLKNAAA